MKVFRKKNEMLLMIVMVVAIAALMYFTGVGCPIVKMTGIPCFGCGMTRAVLCLVRLDFAGAWYYHPLVYLLPFCIAALLLAKRMPRWLIKTILILVVAVFVVTYVFRLFDPANEVVKWHIEEGLFYRWIVRFVQK